MSPNIQKADTSNYTYGTTPTTVSNEGTQKYIEGMKYAYGDQAKADADAALKAASDAINAHYQNRNDALIAHGYSQPGDLKYLNMDGAAPVGESSEGGNVGSGKGGDSGNGAETVYADGINNGGSRYSLGGSKISAMLQNLRGKNFPGNKENVSDKTTNSTLTVEDSYRAQMEAANERLKQAYEFQQQQLQKAKEDAFREAWIKQQMVSRAYPEQLAAAGINGGAAQGVLARNNADYAKLRSSVYNDYISGLNTAGQTYQQGIMANNENYLANIATLAEMAEQYKYDEKLARLKASLG